MGSDTHRGGPTRVPDEVKEAILHRTDLVALVQEVVELKRSGTRFKGLCPFHSERDASFTVDPGRGRFHCFGCEANGDAIHFVRETRGLTFVEALRMLGERCGVEVPEVQVSDEEEAARRERKEHAEWLRKANELATAWFERSLAGPGGEGARSYLQRRGIGADIRQAFRLGYAPDSWDALVHHLQRKGVPVRYAVEAGLARERSSGGGHYAFFRNRLACPITDKFGRVVAFSCRALAREDEERGKYVNSPESPIFRKRRLVFGLEQARKAIRTKGRAVLVEGNFDVLSLHAAGFDEAVGSLGTALTAHQVTELHRQAEQVVLLYDGDAAGRKSALAAVPLFVEGGLMVRVAVPPDGLDPDDVVRQRGPEALAALLDAAVPGVEFAIRTILPERSAAPEDKQKAVAAVGRLVAKVDGSMARAEYRRLTADLLGVEERLLGRYFQGAGPAPRVSAAPPRRSERRDRSGEELLRLLVDHPDLVSRARAADVVDLVWDEPLVFALRAWLDLEAAGREAGGVGALTEALEEEGARRVAARACSRSGSR